MKIKSKRMRMLADMIPECECLLDIGCDHGILETLLAKRYPDMNIIACDISEKALKKTEKTVEHLMLSDRVSCRCGDGFSVLNAEDDVDCAVIAGIGGYVITEILRNGNEHLNMINDFFFLPSTDTETLRQNLPDLDLKIENEWTVEEQNRVYFLIRAKHGRELHTETRDFRYGYHLVMKKDELLLKSLRKHHQALSKALKMIEDTGNTEKTDALKSELTEAEDLIVFIGGDTK